MLVTKADGSLRLTAAVTRARAPCQIINKVSYVEFAIQRRQGYTVRMHSDSQIQEPVHQAVPA